VTPEAIRFLAKASRILERATTMLSVGLSEDAGRSAYLAGFHAAQAFLFDSTGKTFKSHRGVQKEFLRLTKDDPRFTSEQRIFLSQTYNLKETADYETGPGSEVSAERAIRAVDAGKQFLSHISVLLSNVSPTPPREDAAPF
jgi:uncharacterized protein (UPF0332 family)